VELRSVSDQLSGSLREDARRESGKTDGGSTCGAVSRRESHAPGAEEDDDASLSVAMSHRRRAVDASDLRQCALVQTKMKSWKVPTGYVYSRLVKLAK